MINNIDEFKIIIKIPELNTELSSYDVDYQVYKSAKLTPDTAYINIWNLEESFYTKILTSNFKIQIYIQEQNRDSQLMFNGYTNGSLIKRGTAIPSIANKDRIPRDKYTVLKLTNSKGKYQDYSINKAYREGVTSSQIIQDCLSEMEMESVILSETLEEKSYPNYKATGKPHTVISAICDAIGCEGLLQDEIFYLGTPSENTKGENIPELSLQNALYPEYKGENEKSIVTKFNPTINPTDFVRCNFEDFCGVYPVTEVETSGNNYNTEGVTKLTIRLN